MNICNLIELKKIDTSKVSQKLISELRYKDEDNQNAMHIKIKSMVCAYIIDKMQSTMRYDSFTEFMEKVDVPAKVNAILEAYGSKCWNVAINNLSDFTSYELLAYILFDNSYENPRLEGVSTPSEILQLAISILDIKADEEVLELCSGKGNFIVEAATKGVVANYTGVELNETIIMIANLRTAIIKDNFEYCLADAFEFQSKMKVNKVFANYPFLMKSPIIDEHKKHLENNIDLPKEVIKKLSSDWLFNLKIVDQLDDEGKAVVLMTNGSTWNATEQVVRQYFVENGYIESVVSLAPNLLYDTMIPISLVVLSKNNSCVRLVDAKDLFVGERRKNVLSQSNIDSIIQMLNQDGELSTTKTIQELAANEFVLNASRYFEVLPTIEEGVEFESVIKKITRGCQLRASELDVYKSSTPTNYQYLILSNINDGVITLDNEDQYLKEIPANLERYCIKNNSLVFSKTGMPVFKSAVAQIEEGKKVIANGNLFIIELDETKINPFYIQAFFASEVGTTILKSIYTGAKIPTLTLDKFKKMMIPLPSLVKQEEIGKKYAESMKELVLLTTKIENVKNRMKHIFDEDDRFVK